MKLKAIPASLGFRGNIEQAMREAKATEFNDIRRLVYDALEAVLNPGNQQRVWFDTVGLFASEVVISQKGRYLSYPYSLSENNQIVLGTPKEVVKGFTPVGVSHVTEALDDNVPASQTTPEPQDGDFLREALDAEKGLKWRVLVVGAGLSGNNNNYPPKVLREAAPMFNGVRVFNKSDEEHLQGKGKAFKNLIGQLSNSQFIEAAGTQPARIEADLTLLESGGVHTKMLECWNKGMKDMFGFSIDAYAITKKVTQGGKRLTEAQKFTRVSSLDLIIEPGAGGTLLNLLEAKKGANTMLLKKMVEAINKYNPDLLQGVDVENEEDVSAAHTKMVEALALASQQEHQNDDTADKGSEGITAQQLREALDTERARTYAVTRLAESKMPEKAKEKLNKTFAAMEHLTEAQVDEEIKSMNDLIGSFGDNGKIQMPHGGAQYSNVDDGKQLLEALMDPKNKEVTSLREAYLSCTGDTGFTGRIANCSKTRLAEALDSSDFPSALGEAIHKRLLDLYAQTTIYDGWRQFVDIVPINDFRTQERVFIGGYGDLAAVAEKGNYQPMTSPGDGKESYAISKRGGTENITLEMIANDDIGALMRIPGKMNEAAKRTCSKFFWNMFVSNPVMNDGKAWFHADHGNLGSAALSASAYAAGRLAMMRQTEPGSDAELGLMSKFLLVPAELEETAFDAFKRDTNLDETFAQSLKPTIIPVWCWTDANDWVQTCDKSSHPIIEGGFFQGREEPEMFIQDNPTVGSMFTNDTVTYKIRHIYGGAPMSYSGVRKNAVA